MWTSDFPIDGLTLASKLLIINEFVEETFQIIEYNAMAKRMDKQHKISRLGPAMIVLSTSTQYLLSTMKYKF